MTTLKYTVSEIKSDLPNKNFTFKSLIKSYLFSASFRVLLNYRLGKYFFKSGSGLLRLLGSHYRVKLITRRNCDFSYNSKIGKKLRMPHPMGIVIGSNVIIGDNVTIFQQVTLGSHGKSGEKMKYPIIEDNVIIYAGAKIVGDVQIGANSIIGANSFVNISIPPNSIAVGVPCKILKK